MRRRRRAMWTALAGTAMVFCVGQYAVRAVGVNPPYWDPFFPEIVAEYGGLGGLALLPFAVWLDLRRCGQRAERRRVWTALGLSLLGLACAFGLIIYGVLDKGGFFEQAALVRQFALRSV